MSMRFIKIGSMDDGRSPLRDRLLHELNAGKDVLWLIPGGSNIPLSAAIMGEIPDDMTARLTLLLTDERYGEVDHPDSNQRQLREAGFDMKQARFLSVLDGSSLEDTVHRYGQNFQKAASAADIIIGQFGMGADGHIAGCLPGSPAVASGDFTAGYAAGQYTRITLTPKAISQITSAYLFAFGAEKLPALEKLHTRDAAIDEQPAQIIKQLPEAFVYNDQIGDQA